MELKQKKYYGKVLLFGEYTVLQGSNALAVPSRLFYGQWSFAPSGGQKQPILFDLCEYLGHLDLPRVQFEQKRFQDDLERGLTFAANLPIGYGVGSSGAVCAAIFDIYYQKAGALSTVELKAILAGMENFFHGSSSGLDPLVSFLDQAIFIKEGQLIKTTIPEPKERFHLFLLDTGVSRRTAPLVEIYLEKLEKDTDFKSLIETQLVAQNNQAIAQFKTGATRALFDTFAAISAFQYEYFTPMILDSWKALWRTSLTSDFYQLKLCGAGGGGFILGITNDWKRLELQMTEQDKTLYQIY